MAPFDGTELGSSGSDGLGMAPRVGEPESNLIPGMAAPLPPGPQIGLPGVESLLGPLVPPNITDTSTAAPQPPGLSLQEAPRWQYDFDPANALARATFPGEVSFVSGGPTVPVVSSFNTRTGAVTLSTADVAAVLNIVIRVTVFSAGGTWTPNPNMLAAQLETIGGGAGGGGAFSGTGHSSGGGGGGAGSYSRVTISKATAGASQAVTIGTAGTGGAGTAPGTAGTATSIGSLCVAPGGAPGGGGPDAGNGTGGAGGTAGTGDVQGTGMSGQGGIGTGTLNFPGFGGAGGSASPFGSGGNTQLTSGNGPGTAATGHGSGGGGAGSYNSVGGNATGGAGSPGLAIVTEYCSQ
jgi:hypothetical protein